MSDHYMLLKKTLCFMSIEKEKKHDERHHWPQVNIDPLDKCLRVWIHHRHLKLMEPTMYMCGHLHGLFQKNLFSFGQ